MSEKQIQDWELKYSETKEKDELLQWLAYELRIQKHKNKKIIKKLNLPEILTL